MGTAKIELADFEDETPSIDLDAKEFGRHSKQGGWRLGLLVARCCTKEQQGKRTDLGTSSDVEKVSCSEFARRAGVSDRTVRYYLDAWDLAAKDGVRQASSKLHPGDDDLADLEEDDEDDRILWSHYYGLARKPKIDAKPEKKKPEPSTKTESNSIAEQDNSISKKSTTSDQQIDQVIRVDWLTENLETIRVSTEKISHLTAEANSDKEIDLIKQIMAEADALYKAAKAQLSVLGLDAEAVEAQQDSEDIDGGDDDPFE